MFSFTPTWRHFLSDIYVDQGSNIVTENAQISVCHGLQNCANLPLASERLSFKTTTTGGFWCGSSIYIWECSCWEWFHWANGGRLSACVTLWRQLQTRFIPCESSDQCTNVCSDSIVFLVVIPQMYVSMRKHVNSGIPKCHSSRCHLISSVYFYTRSN